MRHAIPPPRQRRASQGGRKGETGKALGALPFDCPSTTLGVNAQGKPCAPTRLRSPEAAKAGKPS
jgi:hypothetical protein